MRRRNKFDIYLVIGIFLFTICYFLYTHSNAESKGIEIYSNALKIYKAGDFEDAYKEFGKIQYG